MTAIEQRNNEIIRYNIIGVVMNLSLSVGKLITGTVFNSHAVILDGVNSLSDLVSEIFAIIATKIGARSADAQHPFGYGRLEYVSSLIITMIILYVGATSIVDSIKSILYPHEPPHYSFILIFIMVISLIAKLGYGMLMRRRGKALESAAMIMTGTESMGDSLVAVAVLLSYMIYRFTGADVEHYLCIFIALLIIRTGIDMIRQCMTKILGERVDPELRKQIVHLLTMEPGVMNFANLVIHSYGEGVHVGSVDIEVDEEMKASQINVISRSIKHKAAEYGVMITSVGITGTNVTSEEAADIWDRIIAQTLKHDSILRAQSFNVDFEQKLITFSVVENPKEKNREADINRLQEELQSEFPDMKIEIDIAPNT